MKGEDEAGRGEEPGGQPALGDEASRELRTALPPALEDWRRRSATGAILTGIAFGLRQALDTPREEPAIVVEAPGEPPGPARPMELHMDPDRPEETWVIVRPWLLDE